MPDSKLMRMKIPETLALLTTILSPVMLAAQQEPKTDHTVQVAIAGFTLAPLLTETGVAVLDNDDAPVLQRIPLDESVITPGDQVLYVIAVENPTEILAANLQLGVQIAAELLLDPYSIVGPDGLDLEWAADDAPSEFAPLFAELDGETVLQADLDTLRALRLTLPALSPSDDFSVEYIVTLR